MDFSIIIVKMIGHSEIENEAWSERKLKLYRMAFGKSDTAETTGKNSLNMHSKRI